MIDINRLIHCLECINFHNNEIDSTNLDFNCHSGKDPGLDSYFKKNIEFHNSEKYSYIAMIEDNLKYKIDLDNNSIDCIIEELHKIRISDQRLAYDDDNIIDELWREFNKNYKVN